MLQETKPQDNSLTEIEQNIGKISGTVVGKQYNYNYPTPHLISPHERRNRQHMIDKVQSFWIQGVLEDSLFNEVMLQIGMVEKPEAVDNPWNLFFRTHQDIEKPVPPRKRIIDVFDEVGGELIILGEPGSGKTTMMLDLARHLIERAEEDEAHPIPVVFNLSSWANDRKPIKLWLVDELNARYQIPRSIGQAWVATDQILPLLDGLDEVRNECRSACAQALNDFQVSHGMMPTVVTCRSTEYETLKKKLKFQGAIVLQPLSATQADDYIDKLNIDLSTIRHLIREDRVLRELINTPLMLSIIVLASQGLTVERRPSITSLEEWRKHLFNIYIQRMIERRGEDKRFSHKKTLHWLSWLALKMKARGQTVFYIERLQPNLLDEDKPRRLYGALAASLFGLMTGFVLGVANGPLFGLVVGLGCMLAMAFTRRTVFGIGVGLVFGLAFMLPGRSVFGFPISYFSAPSATLFGLILGIVLAVAMHLSPNFAVDRDHIKIQSLGWSWIRALCGVAVGAFLGLTSGLLTNVVYGIAFGVSTGLGLGLAFGLTNAEAEIHTYYFQGIRKSGFDAARISLAVGLLTGITIGIILILLKQNVQVSLSNAITFALSISLFGMFYGGITVIQHLALRYVLTRTDVMPWNYAGFLNYAAHCIFLRKVGGGYIFIHRLLLDHFAAMFESGYSPDDLLPQCG